MKFRRNPAFGPQLRQDPRFRAEMVHQAHRVRDRAEAIAPRGPTGMYHRSLKVLTGERVPFVGKLAELAGTANQATQTTRVVTTDFAGHIVEFGSVNSPVYAVLRRAALMSGLKLRPPAA